VQRALNPRRINSVKQFTIEVGDFPGVIILNWVDQENPLPIRDNELILPIVARGAQIIDGQYRLAGIRAAIDSNPEIYDLQLPVAIYENLTTRQCADIFLSINNEQKTVPRSLVFDLYGIASEPTIDAAATRARDIAIFLNEEEGSPYKDAMKLPGAPRKKGGIALSTAVTALKDFVEESGNFEQIGATELELQQRNVFNYFNVLKDKYADDWDSTTYAFMYASGFLGAIDFFKLRLIPFCNQNRSFQKGTISNAIQMNHSDRILQSEVKGLGGKDAPKKIYERLNEMFNPKLSTSDNLLV
jgi:DNA sulfur modification protein DndB